MSMAEIKTWLASVLTDKVREQSFIVILVVIWGYWISQKNDACNERQIQQYEKQMENLITVIQNNNIVLDRNNQILEKYQLK